MTASIFSSITSPPWGSFWFSVEAICILVVAFGCGAEVWADLHKFSDKFRIDPKSGRLGEKTLGAQRKEWWKIFFGIIVAMGLAVEVMAFSFSFLTSSREI